MDEPNSPAPRIKCLTDHIDSANLISMKTPNYHQITILVFVIALSGCEQRGSSKEQPQTKTSASSQQPCFQLVAGKSIGPFAIGDQLGEKPIDWAIEKKGAGNWHKMGPFEVDVGQKNELSRINFPLYQDGYCVALGDKTIPDVPITVPGSSQENSQVNPIYLSIDSSCRFDQEIRKGGNFIQCDGYRINEHFISDTQQVGRSVSIN